MIEPVTHPTERIALLKLRHVQDVIACRQQARAIAGMLGFDRYDEVRIAIAASEAARQTLAGGTAGTVEFTVELPVEVGRGQLLRVTITGLPDKTTPLEIGRLVEHVEWRETAAGRVLTFAKALPGRRLGQFELREMIAVFAQHQPKDETDELATYNRELLDALEDANARRQELQRINDELTETNRGVVALYDELDTLHRVGRVVASQIDLDSLLRAITEATMEVSGAEMGAFLTRHPTEDRYDCHTTRGELCHLLSDHPSLATADFFQPLEQGEVLRIDDLAATPSTRTWPGAPVRSYLAIAVKDADGLPVGALVFAHREPRVFTERTERILASVAVQVSIGMQNARLYQNVQAASAAKDQFLAMLSHELRTPLNPVFMLLASLDQNPDLTDEVRRDLQVMRRNLQLEARLIDDLLDLTRIVRGKIALHFETVDVHSLLPVVRDICHEQIANQRSHLELKLEAGRSWVVGDSARLQQVFWNLLSNALKFSPDGRVVISTSNPRPDSLRVEVLDNGRGLRPETLKSIFQPFDQGDSQTNAGFGGLGLGLAISKKVIDAHGGEIFAESEGLGQGSRFIVEIKIADRLEESVLPESPVAAGAPAVKPNSVGRILLVEDHQDTLLTLQRMLTRRGFEVAAASTAQMAAAKADNHTFDLVISDLGLPDRSGHELMRELKDKHGLPGIALSGYGMEADIERSHSAGFVAHLIKPIDFAALEKTIAWVLAAKSTHG